MRRRVGILRGDGDGGGIAARNFLREGWAAERADSREQPSTVAMKHLGDHFGHALQGSFFEALGRADDQGFAAESVGACVRTGRGSVARA